MKKILSLVMALLLVFSSFSAVMAAETYTQAEKIDWLVQENILNGRRLNADGSMDLELNSGITRAEITKLLVFVLGKQTSADQIYGTISPFKDVPKNHWGNGYITVATSTSTNNGNSRIIIGYPDGKFYPEKDVTYGEIAAMLVRITKANLTNSMEKNASWPESYIRWAAEEGILKGLKIADPNKKAPRKDAFEMIFNTMEELGKVKANKSDVTSLKSLVIDGYVAVTTSKDKTDYNINLPKSMSLKNLRASDIRITTTDPKATVTKPVPRDDNKVWDFVVVAENGKDAVAYTLTINGGVSVNSETGVDSVSVYGIKATRSLTDDTKFYVSLPSKYDVSNVRDWDVEIIPTNKDAKVSKIYSSDLRNGIKFAVVSSNGINMTEYTIYTDGYYYGKAKAGADLVVARYADLSRYDAEKAIDSWSYDPKLVRSFSWYTKPSTATVRENVPGVVEVLYMDGSRELVDVYVDVRSSVYSDLVYRFTVDGYGVSENTINPDRLIGLRVVESQSGYTKLRVIERDGFTGSRNFSVEVSEFGNTFRNVDIDGYYITISGYGDRYTVTLKFY